MTMGCKYQVVSCAHPLDLYQICLNHLDALRVLVRTAPEVAKLVENCVRNMEEMFARMRVGDLHLLRYTLARFFQDRRVKVSLFLTDNLQAQDGSMIHTHAGRLPLGADKPGTIRYFDNGILKKEEVVRVANGDHILPPAVGVDISKPGRPCELGTNLYAKDRRKKGLAGASKAPANAKSSAGSGAGSSKGAPQQFEPDEASKAAAKGELNMLAQMIGGGRAVKEGEKFSIVNLFPDASLSSDGGGGEMKADIICFDTEDREARQAKLSKQFGGLTVDQRNDGDDDDLLDLMDKQSKSKYDD